MSFIESLWVSLTQAHAMPHSSTFPSNTAPTMTGQQPPKSTSQPQERDSEQQAARSYSEDSNCNRRFQRPGAGVPGGSQGAQRVQVDLGQNSDAPSGSNGSFSGLVNPSTMYTFAQPAASPWTMAPTPSCMTSTVNGMIEDSTALQPSMYFSPSNNGEYAYSRWPQQPQQPQPPPPPHHASASLSVPASAQPHAQMQYTGLHQGIDGTWQQLCMIYDQPAVQAHNSSYLSAAGVPFDLHSNKEMPQPLSPAEKVQTGDGATHSRQYLASSIVSTPEPSKTNRPGSAVFGLHTQHKSTSQKQNTNVERLREVHRDTSLTVVAPSGRHNAKPTAQVNDRKGAIKARPGAKFSRHAAPANTAPANTAPANTAPANTAPANTAPTNTPPRLHQISNKTPRKDKVNTSTAVPWNRGKMPNSSTPAPPPKPVKGKQATLPVPKRTDVNNKPKASPTPAPALGAWGNFAAHIAQDDKSVAAKARDVYEQEKGTKVRSEFRETYKDQKGKKETTVHEGVAGLVGSVTNESQNGDDASKMEKKTPGDDAHVGAHGDDAGSYEGGVALSPSE